MALEFQVLGSIFSSIKQGLGVDYAALGQLMGLFMLPGIFLALPAGMLGSRFGLKRLAVLSLLMLASGSLIFSFSHDQTTAMLGRLLGGAGNALLSVLVSAMVTEWFRDRDLATALAIVFVSWQFGLAVALALFPMIAEAASWRWSFHLTTFVCLGVAVLMALFYRSPTVNSAPRMDLPSLRLIFRRQSILPTIAGVIWSAYNVGQIIFLTYAPTLLVSTRAISAVQASRIVSVTMWVATISMPIGGLLTDRVRWTIFPIVVGLTGAAGAGLAFAAGADPLISCVAVGVFLGLPAGGILAMPARDSAPTEVAWSIGWFMTIFYMLMTLIQVLAGYVRDVSGSDLAAVTFASVLFVTAAIGLIPYERARRTLISAPRAAIYPAVSG